MKRDEQIRSYLDKAFFGAFKDLNGNAMTQEQKAKAYDEALSLMEDCIPDKDGYVRVRPCDIFQELNESEDEKIRKILLESFEYQIKESHPDKEWICGVKLKEIVAWLEKQGEQKPTDTIKPKFEVGDWVVYCGKTCKITGLHNGIFTITNQDGSYFFNQVESTTEPVFHLWTIQDAKEGDVLAADLIEMYSSSFVAIYKKQNEEDFGDFDSYCFVGFDGKFYEGEDGHSLKDTHPATKEQRDLLFQKMKEAGYEFDFEKKELKKINQKPVKWSEEDDIKLNDTINIINDSGYVESLRKPYIDWLKSLKQRMEGQQ